jgi:anti-sigma factor RsiW
MDFTCKEAVPMIGAYLDGELSPARAALLRPHLLECAACRNAAQDDRALKRWFEPARESAEGAAVPSGFSARIARRAFAGDRGERAPVAREEGRVLPFVLRLTAVAAAAALLLTLGVQLASRPQAGNLAADDRAALPLLQIQTELDRMNGVVAPEPAAGTPTDPQTRAPRAKKRNAQPR